jgi:hypothetical protein
MSFQINNSQRHSQDLIQSSDIRWYRSGTSDGLAESRNFRSEFYNVSGVDYQILKEIGDEEPKYFVATGCWEFEAQLEEGDTSTRRLHFLDAQGNAKCLTLTESGTTVQADMPTFTFTRDQNTGFTFKHVTLNNKQLYETDRFVIEENRYFISCQIDEENDVEQYWIVKLHAEGQETYDASLSGRALRFMVEGDEHICQLYGTNAQIENISHMRRLPSPKEESFESPEEERTGKEQATHVQIKEHSSGELIPSRTSKKGPSALTARKQEKGELLVRQPHHATRDPTFIFSCLLALGLFLSAVGVGAATGCDQIRQYGYFIAAGLTLFAIASMLGGVIRWRCIRARYSRV